MSRRAETEFAREMNRLEREWKAQGKPRQEKRDRRQSPTPDVQSGVGALLDTARRSPLMDPLAPTQEEIDRAEASERGYETDVAREARRQSDPLFALGEPIMGAIGDAQVRDHAVEGWLRGVGLGEPEPGQPESDAPDFPWDDVIGGARQVARQVMTGRVGDPRALEGNQRIVRSLGQWWEDEDNEFSRPARMGRDFLEFDWDSDRPIQGYGADFGEAMTGGPWTAYQDARRDLDYENARIGSRMDNGAGALVDTSARDRYAGEAGAAGINAALNLGFGALDAGDIGRAFTVADDVIPDLAPRAQQIEAPPMQDGFDVPTTPYNGPSLNADATLAQVNRNLDADDRFYDRDTVNDLDQWIMGGYTEGAPARGFVLDDLIDEQRNIERTTPRSDRFDLESFLRANDWADDHQMRAQLDLSLGEYGVGGTRENRPLLEAGAIGTGTGLGIAALQPGEAEAGEGGEGEGGGDWLMPVVGGVTAAALARPGALRSVVGSGGGAPSRNTGVNGVQQRLATVTRTENDFADQIASARDTVRRHRDLSLQDWVAQKGGISDDRGDLINLNEGRGRGWHRIVRTGGGGRTIDDLAIAAWEDGYFTQIPTRTEFIDAVRANSAGPLAGAGDEAAEVAAARDVLREAEARGIDIPRRGGGLRGRVDRAAPETVRTVEETVELSIPDDPSRWREILNAHPWINTPSRAQLVIMENARLPNGARRYSGADIAEATGYDLNSVKVVANRARAAGVPLDRHQGARAGVQPGGETLPRALDILERSLQSGQVLSVKALAERLSTTPTSLKALFSRARNARGNFSSELVARMRAYDEAVSKATGRPAPRARETSDDIPFAFAALSAGGLGGALLWPDEAEARKGDGDESQFSAEMQDWMAENGYFERDGLVLENPSADAPLPSERAMGQFQVRGNLILRDYGNGRVYAFERSRDEAGGASDRLIGRVVDDVDTPRSAGRDSVDLPEEEHDFLGDLRIPLSVGLGLAARGGAGRIGIRGGAREAIGAATAGGVDWASGGSAEESLLLAAANPIGGRVLDDVLRVAGPAIDNFGARIDGPLPASEVPANARLPRGIDFDPLYRVPGVEDTRNTERAARGIELQQEMARRASEEQRARLSAASDSGAIGQFVEPGSGRSLFGEPPKPRGPRPPLPPLDERAAEAGAQGAMRGVSAGAMREMAEDLGIATDGVKAGDLRRSLVRELGRRFDSTRELVAFLQRYGVSAAALGIGVGAIGVNMDDPFAAMP